MDAETTVRLIVALERISEQLACLWGIGIALTIIMVTFIIKR